MDKLIEKLNNQPKTVKPEQRANTERFSDVGAGGVGGGGGHCQGGGSW
ncbi:hypothetical protein [Halomonas sp. 328]|nr:hypothetical protein [Halomonas sp. 328]MBF8224530.1 hypothetical protein [Halomonas sp. 328]